MPKKTITRTISIPADKVAEAKQDLRLLHDPHSLCYGDGYYARSLAEKWKMSVSDLESLVGRPTYVEKWIDP